MKKQGLIALLAALLVSAVGFGAAGCGGSVETSQDSSAAQSSPSDDSSDAVSSDGPSDATDSSDSASDNSSGGSEDAVVTGIEVTPPDKDTYYLDERASAPDLTGLAVVAQMSDGSTKEIPLDEVDVSDADLTRVSDDILVTVTYGEYSDSFYLVVRKRAVTERELADSYHFDRAGSLTFADEGVTELVTLDGGEVEFSAEGGSVVVEGAAFTETKTVLRVNKADGYRFVEVVAETHISDIAGFRAMSENPDGYYVLDNSIDFENSYISPVGTVPVGYASEENFIDTTGAGMDPSGVCGQLGRPFTGTFDGNGYLLYNFRSGLGESEAYYAADCFGRSLFGYIGESGVVKNFTIGKYTLEGGQSSAFIAGLNLGRIENVVVGADCTIYSHYGLADAIAAYNGGSIVNAVCYVSAFTKNSGEAALTKIAETTGAGTQTRCYIAPEGEVFELTAEEGWTYVAGKGTVYVNDAYVVSRAESFELPLGGELKLSLYYGEDVADFVNVWIWGNAETTVSWNGEEGSHYLCFKEGWSETAVGDTFNVGFGSTSGGVYSFATITVTAPVLSSVTYDGEETLEVYKGAAFDLSAVVLTERYSDGTTKTVHPERAEGLNTDTEGTQSATFFYKEYSFTVDVTVKVNPDSVTALKLEGEPAGKLFYVGGSISAKDLSGLTLKAVYGSGEEVTVALTAEMLDKTTFAEANDETVVTVSYEGRTASFTVAVYAAPESVSVSLKEGVGSVVYPEGEEIDWSKFVTAADNNGKPVLMENLAFVGDGALNGTVSGKFVYTYNGSSAAESAETTVEFWYGIGSVNEWNNFAAKTGTTEDGFGGRYTLTADIDFQNAVFVPAGGAPSETPNGYAAFAGVFDGNGYALKYVTLPNHNSAAFVNLGGGAIVRNVAFLNFQTGFSGCAVIAVHNYGTIENCLVKNFYDTSSWGAGLVSNNTRFGTVRNCVVDKITFDDPSLNNAAFIKSNAGAVDNCLAADSNAAYEIRVADTETGTPTATNLVVLVSFANAEGESVLTYADGSYSYTAGGGTVVFPGGVWTLDGETKALTLVRGYL